MRLGRESDKVEDRRGSGGGGAGRLGLGGLILALVALYFGVDPAVVMQIAGMGGQGSSVSTPASGGAPADEAGRFVSMVLADTEDTWGPLFAANGRRYEEPVLVLFSGSTRSACGVGQAAMGPFYCPMDRKLYIDLSFYDELKQRYRAPGDFAQAYVIAHEVGHHVQNLLGISAKAGGAPALE